MEFFEGQVVRSRAGHDKDLFFVILSLESTSAVICDGKTRKLEKPKKKNLKHLCPTHLTLSEDHLKTNKQIRTSLRELTRAERA